jgi:hypothetical protein
MGKRPAPEQSGNTEAAPAAPAERRHVSRRGRINEGKPPWAPAPEQRKQIETMAGHGIPRPVIAQCYGISENTLRKHCRSELDRAAARGLALLANSAWRQAVGAPAEYAEPEYDKDGNPLPRLLLREEIKPVVAMTIFQCKVRLGWKERLVHEILPTDLSRLSDKELATFERLVSKIATVDRDGDQDRAGAPAHQPQGSRLN